MSVVERIVLEPNYQRIPLFSNFLVKGKVLDRAGNPISGIPIRFYDLNTNTLIGYDTSKIDGSVQFGYILGEKTKLKIVGRYEQYGKTLAESNIVEVESYSLTDTIPTPSATPISATPITPSTLAITPPSDVITSGDIDDRTQKYDVVSITNKDVVIKQDVIYRLGEVLTINNIVNPPEPPYEYGVLTVKFTDYGQTYNLLKIDDIKGRIENCIREYETQGFYVEKATVYCDEIKIEGIDISQITEQILGDLYGNVYYKLRFEFTGYMIIKSPIVISPLIITLVKWIASAFISFMVTKVLGDWLTVKKVEAETTLTEITLEKQIELLRQEIEKIKEEYKQAMAKMLNQQITTILTDPNLDPKTKQELINQISAQVLALQKAQTEQELQQLKAQNEALQKQIEILQKQLQELKTTKPTFEEQIGKYVGYAILVVVIIVALYFIVKMFVFKGGGE